MKKTFALLVALMLLAAMLPVSAMAYTAPQINDTSFEHTLTLTEAQLKKLPEGVVIAYTYSVATTARLMTTDADGNAVFSDAKGVTGAPIINGNNSDKVGSVVFNSDTAFTNGVATETMSVDWENVNVTEPGVYLWKVTKAIDTTLTVNTDNAHSDEDTEFFLYAIVLNSNDNSSLRVSAVGIAMGEDLTVANNKGGSVDDTYPVKKVSLQLKKQVSGTMASANQYFCFKINLETLPGTYTIDLTHASEAVPGTAYNSGTSNDSTITVDATGKGDTDLWLKHGESITITDLPYGTSYTIMELSVDGFEVSATVDVDKDAKNTASADYTVSDENLTDDAVVTYINKKDAPVSTGIVLNTAAPMMGLLLALSLLAVMFIGKRKEFEA